MRIATKSNNSQRDQRSNKKTTIITAHTVYTHEQFLVSIIIFQF